MASVQERFNNILNRIEENQVKTQAVQERFNNIVNRVNLQQESFNKRRPIAVEKIANTNNQQRTNNSQSQQQVQKQTKQALPNLSEDYIQRLPASQQATARRIQEQTQKLNSMSASDRQKALDNLQSNQNKSTIIPSANVEKIEGKTLTKSDLEKIKNIDNKTYYKVFGKGGFAGVNNMINEFKRTPELLNDLKETSVEVPGAMGIRGGVAGIVDSATTEMASYIDDPNGKEWNPIKRKAQKVMSTYMPKEVRKALQDKMLSVTDSYYKDYAKYKDLESRKSQGNQYIDTVVEGTSRMVPSLATTFVTGNPNAGLVATGLSAKGSSTQEALRDGATLDQAITMGNVSMLTEMATEKIWSGIKLPGGKSMYGDALGDAMENFILSKLKSNGAKWLASKGMDIAGEIAEEFISDTVESIAKKSIYDKNAKLPTASEYANTAKVTAGTTVLLNLLTGGFLQTPNNTQNFNKTINQNTESQEQVQKSSTELAEKNNIPNLQQNSTINQNINQQQQIIQEQSKKALNQNVEGENETKFSKILNNKDLPQESYEYEKSDNIKIDSLRQQANKHFNNTQEAHNFVGMLEKIITDKNITINFDTNLGKNVNGSYNNGVITINPNSTRAGEFLAIHELTHAIGTDSMIKMVDNYRKSNAEFDSQVQNLLKKYNQNEINEEALADVAGQLFGNQEYINNLSKTNPNMFKRIYNEIKYLWHQFRGYKNQDQFVDDLMFKWEEAYRNNNKLNDSTNYHISENLSNDIDSILKNGTTRNKIQVRDYTPQVLVDVGLEDLPMLMKSSHIRENILSLDEAKKIGLKVNDKTHYHGLGKDTFIKAIDQLDNPVAVYRWKDNNGKNNYSSNDYIVLTELVTKENGKDERVIVPLFLKNNKGFYEVKTVYGKNRVFKYLNDNKNELEKLQIKRTNKIGRVQFPTSPKGSSNNSIAPSNENVNTTKYSMQESENNSGSFNLPKTDSTKEYNYQSLRPKPRGGWTIEKIQKQLKHENSTRLNSKELSKFDNIEDLMNNLYYHGSISAHDHLKAGSTLKESERTGGYGEAYHTISLSGNKNIASNFASIGNSGTVTPVILKKGANVIEMLDIEDSIELEEMLPELWGKGVDAVKIGDWDIDTKGYGEQEIVILNPNAIMTLPQGRTYFQNYHKPKFNNMTKQEVIDAIKKTRDSYLMQSDYQLEKIKDKKTEIEIQQFKKQVEKYKKVYDDFINKSNEKYSKDNSTWQEYLEKEFPAKGTRTNMQDIKQGTNLPTGKNAKETTNKADINLPPKVSANNQYKDTKTKIRKHYKSIIESTNTTPEAKAIAKQLMGTDTYIPETNKNQLEKADERISQAGPESELDSLMARSTVGDKITSVDIAVGERLIQYYSKTGDATKLRDAIQATAMAGTTAGQAVQAFSLLNHQTPEGQAVWLQRSVEKMNNDLKKQRGAKAEQLNLTDDMINKIMNSENSKELRKNLDEVYKELGQQVTKTTIQKIDAWRYFSMLANPRTHIRNIIGNFAMARVQSAKNKVAGITEGVVSKFNKNMERTHTIVPASKDVKAFAKADIENVSDRLGLTEGKLNPKSRIESNMRTFKHKVLENTIGKAFAFNDFALEAEDGWGLKAGYTKALAEYMTANKLKPDTITDAQLAKARNYAVQQAKEATFHQDCQLATLINQLSNKNKFAKYTVDAILPFKKTPMNIAKTGFQYSPMQIAKSMVYDTVQLRKGNITVNQYIENVSKGLTGTGIALVGYALASMGIVKASGGDDDKEKYEQNLGKQTFSITVGDNTYSLDWLAPSAIPLFIGAEIFSLSQDSSEKKTSTSSDEDSRYNQVVKTATNVLDSFANSMNPMMEMSMLSGLTSALKSYEQGSSQMIATMGTNAVQSYVNQFFPTALGQIAKTTDEYERSTTSTKSGVLPKAIDTTKNQIMSKIPGLRQKLPVKTDIWGNEKKQSANLPLRAVENAIFPWSRKEISNSDVDKELERLYDINGNQAVIPDSSFSKDLTFSGQKYRMTSGEYANYRKTYGDKSYKLINELIKSNEYEKLTDEEKQTAVEKIYTYAKEYCKNEYAENNDIDYEQSKMFTTVQKLEKSNGNASSYFDYLSKTTDMKDKQKIDLLASASYSKTDKKIIYENTLGSDDSLYNNAMKYTGININEYLKYKTQEFTSDKTDDGTVNGKSVSGSKKAKVYDYVNKMKITGEQRMLLLGTQYKLTDSERATLADYVKNLNITKNQKIEIYKKLQGFTVYKDGRVTY